MTKHDQLQNIKHYHLTLYIAGNGPNSRMAQGNVADLCARELIGRCTMKTVDVLEDFAAAMEYDILVTPTLLITTDAGNVTVVGNLSRRDKVIAALGLNEGAE